MWRDQLMAVLVRLGLGPLWALVLLHVVRSAR